MNNEHELLLFGLQDLAWDSKLVFHPFFIYLLIYWFLLNCSSVCYLCLEFLVVGGKVKQEEEVPGAKMSARQIGNTGITRQRHHPTIKDSEIKPRFIRHPSCALYSKCQGFILLYCYYFTSWNYPKHWPCDYKFPEKSWSPLKLFICLNCYIGCYCPLSILLSIICTNILHTKLYF